MPLLLPLEWQKLLKCMKHQLFPSDLLITQMEVTEHLKRSLNHHKKVTKNCKEHVILLVVTVTARGFASPNSNCSSSWVDSLATNRDFCAKTHLMLFFRVDDVDPNTTTTAILLVVVIDRWIDKFTVRPMGSYGLGKSF